MASVPSATALVPAPGVTHDRDSTSGGLGDVDAVDADAGARQHPQQWHPVEQRAVDQRVGACDRARGPAAGPRPWGVPRRSPRWAGGRGPGPVPRRRAPPRRRSWPGGHPGRPRAVAARRPPRWRAASCPSRWPGTASLPRPVALLWRRPAPAALPPCRSPWPRPALVRSASRYTGALRSPGTPRAWDRSRGPTNSTSTPSSAAISSTVDRPPAVSICTTPRTSSSDLSSAAGSSP